VRREEKLGAGRGQRGIVRDGRAIDRKACARQRLERGVERRIAAVRSDAPTRPARMFGAGAGFIVQLRQRVEQRKDRLRTDYRQMLPKIPSPPLSRNWSPAITPVRRPSRIAMIWRMFTNVKVHKRERW
jgi:hypothetical protein